MPQKCTICTHQKTQEIEQQIIQGIAHTTIADSFGLHHLAIRRHAENHLPEKLVQVVREEKSNHAENILSGIRDLLTRTKDILDRAEADGHNRLALEAIKEARTTYELLSKIAVKLEEYRRKDEAVEEDGIQDQLQEGLEVLTTPELKTLIALQAKIYSAREDYELEPEERLVVESLGNQPEFSPRTRLREPTNTKNTGVTTQSDPPEPDFEDLGDFDLELDDLSLGDAEEIPSEKSDPEWLVQWRKENPI